MVYSRDQAEGRSLGQVTSLAIKSKNMLDDQAVTTPITHAAYPLARNNCICHWTCEIATICCPWHNL